MNFGNVLVIGSSGIGKTTLIKKVLGSNMRVLEDVQSKGSQRLEIYESLSVPFRIIDAHDMGKSFLSRQFAIRAVKNWSKQTALDGNTDNDINVIWFCIEGKSRKLIRQQLDDLSRATDVWRSVPVIVVLTKSYAATERDENIELVKQQFARTKRRANNLKAVIPVVASTYRLDDSTFVAPEGIPELIDATNEAIPEGLRAAEDDIAEFTLKRRRSVARSITAASAAVGITVAAVPIPISDALILTPIETALVNSLATLYGVGKGSTSKKLLATILEVGTVSTAAKAAISALKAVPGVNVAASVLNAAVAGSIVAAIGEGSTRIFERIYVGEKSLDDVDWARELVESSISKNIVAQSTKIMGRVAGVATEKDPIKVLTGLVSDAIKAGSKQQTAAS